MSPWAPEPDAKGWESSDTVSPWPDPGVPSDVEARIDVRLGEGEKRKYEAPLVRRGIYDRPYLLRVGSDSTAVALGGYLDFLGAYEREEGVSDGFSFEARRFNIFITSRIADRIRLTSEIEFAHGGEEILLETALVDIMFHHAFNLRAGILLVPLGKFNLTHDAPLWDVIDRPLVSTDILAATLSEPGAGFFGAFYPGGGNRLTYEVFVTSGLREGVIAAEGTRLPGGKSPEIFEEDNNGSPAVSGRIAYVSPSDAVVQGELGVSAYGAVYNTFEIEGAEVDEPRWLRALALDAELGAGPLSLRGEVAFAHVDVPPGLTDIHAHDQFGAYVDGTVRFFDRPLWLFERASLAAVVRLDYVDLNLNTRDVTQQPMGAETTRLSVGLSFRPAPGTALRLVYHHDWLTDDLDTARRAAGVQLGLATYF